MDCCFCENDNSTWVISSYHTAIFYDVKQLMAISFGENALLGKDLYPTQREVFCHPERGWGNGLKHFFNSRIRCLEGGIVIFPQWGVWIFSGTTIVLYIQ